MNVELLIADVVRRVVALNVTGEHHLFFHYYGHVQQLSIDIHLGGYSESGNLMPVAQFYVNRDSELVLRHFAALHEQLCLLESGMFTADHCCHRHVYE